MANYKITHLTSVHPRNDTRIFIKECRSFVDNGYDVNLVVSDDNKDEILNGVRICNVGKLKGRIKRILKTSERIFNKAIELNSDIYHFHDPELIPIALKLKKRGKKVIYDVHEDVPRQLMEKPYIAKIIRPFISKIFELYENYSAKKFDAVITATPFIRDRFNKINKNVIDINNYPIIDELKNQINWHLKRNEVCYIGGITLIRGIKEIINSLDFVQSDVRLNLGGNFSEKEVEADMKRCKGWVKVNELGFLNRSDVKNTLLKSKAGLVTFLPAPNHFNAQPNKMFEYMVSGVPVIASDFPLWKEIVEGNKCGLCVNPFDPVAIAHAIDYIIDNPAEAVRMAKNGQKAVIEKYNWEVEEKKLLTLYGKLVK